MFIDWNTHGILGPFYLKGSNHEFISRDIKNETYFIDLDSDLVVPFDFMDSYGLDFYRKDDDEDYLGVWIDL